SEPQLAAFLDAFNTSVLRRDADGLLALLVENITSGWFGPDVAQGREAFAKFHELRNPKRKFWSDVEWLLSASLPYLEWGHNCLPYASERFPENYELTHAHSRRDPDAARAASRGA